MEDQVPQSMPLMQKPSAPCCSVTQYAIYHPLPSNCLLVSRQKFRMISIVGCKTSVEKNLGHEHRLHFPSVANFAFWSFHRIADTG